MKWIFTELSFDKSGLRKAVNACIYFKLKIDYIKYIVYKAIGFMSQCNCCNSLMAIKLRW